MMSDVLLPPVAEKLRRGAWYILTHSYAHNLQLTHAEVLADMTYRVLEREASEPGFITAHTPSYVSHFAGWACREHYRKEYRNYQRLTFPILDETETTFADLLPDFTREVINQLSEPARAFVQHVLDLGRAVMNDTALSRRKFMALTGWSEQQYLRGRLLARLEIAARVDSLNGYCRQVVATDRTIAERNRQYRAILAPNNEPRKRDAHGRYTS